MNELTSYQKPLHQSINAFHLEVAARSRVTEINYGLKKAHAPNDEIKKPWGAYAHPVLDRFNHNCEGLLILNREVDITDFVINTVGNNGVVVETAGPGGLLREITQEYQSRYYKGEGQAPFSHALAMSLGDGRTPEEKEFDAKHNVDFRDGNLGTQEGWINMRNWGKLITGRERMFADLIINNPQGGWYYLPPSAAVYARLVESSWVCLKPGGTLITSLPSQINLDTLGNRLPRLLERFDLYMKQLMQKGVLDYHRNDSAIVITRTTDTDRPLGLYPGVEEDLCYC